MAPLRLEGKDTPFTFVYCSYVTAVTHAVTDIWSRVLVNVLLFKFFPGHLNVCSSFPLSTAVHPSLCFQCGALPHSRCALATLVPWLQGFHVCIYSVFIGARPYFLSAYQQPPCTPPTNLPDTALGFQDATGRGCSHSRLTRPWCSSSPFSHLLLFIKGSWNHLIPVFLWSFHHTFFFIIFSVFHPLSANPLVWLSSVSGLTWAVFRHELLCLPRVCQKPLNLCVSPIWYLQQHLCVWPLLFIQRYLYSLSFFSFKSVMC